MPGRVAQSEPMTEAEFLERFDARMERSDRLLEQMREDHRQYRERMDRDHRQHREQLRVTQATVNSNQDTLREMVAELRDTRHELREVVDGMRATTRGLLHVLNRLEGNGGAGAAPAT